MLKKVVTALGFLLLGSTFALAGNVPTLTGAQDTSNLNATLNSLIISGNAGWAPQGSNFLSAGILSSNSTVAITLTSLGPAGLSPTTIASWLKLKGYINNTTTPTFYLIPLWGCPTCN